MQFMMIVKHGEKQGPPPKELIDAITKMSQEAASAGTMRGSGGLCSDRERRPSPAFGRQTDSDRRSLHRGQRSRRRVRAV